MTYSNKACWIIFLLIVTCVSSSHANADYEENSLIRFKPGDNMPGFSLNSINANKKISIKPNGGTPQVIMFFSLKPVFREKRSINLSEVMTKLKKSYQNRVNFVAVHSDPKNKELLLQYIDDGLFTIPVLDDSQKEIYHRYGIFMLPLAVIISGDGKLLAVVPYTSTIYEIIDNHLKLTLGDWTLSEFKKSFKTKKNISYSEEEKEYIRRVNYGRVMFNRKMYTSAMREFTTATKMMPKSIVALLGLGEVQSALKKWNKAEKTFRKALAIDKESDKALAGLGITLYRQGNAAEALPILENAMITENPSLKIIVTLAEIYEQQGNIEKAIRLNKLAVSRLIKRFE